VYRVFCYVSPEVQVQEYACLARSRLFALMPLKEQLGGSFGSWTDVSACERRFDLSRRQSERGVD
jgi:hypothetical protein